MELDLMLLQRIINDLSCVANIKGKPLASSLNAKLWSGVDPYKPLDHTVCEISVEANREMRGCSCSCNLHAADIYKLL